MRSGARRIARVVALAAALGAALPATAQDAAALRRASLAAVCAACHGTDGHAPPGSAVRGLAGQPASYLVEQMRAFRSGIRPGSVMPQLANGFSDAQIDELAAFFAQQPATPR